MALIGVNSVSQRRPKKDALDKIAQGLNVAQGLLGTALAVPKFMAQRDALKQNAESRKVGDAINLERYTRPTGEGEQASESLVNAGVEGRVFRTKEPTAKEAWETSRLKPASDFPEFYEKFKAVAPEVAAIPNLTIGQVQDFTIDKAKKAGDPYTLLQVELAKLNMSGKQLANTKAELDLADRDKPKELSQATIKNLADAGLLPKELEEYEIDLNKNLKLMGPFVGRYKGANPYESEAQVFQANTLATSQNFGKFMEEGVLRKEDEKKYERMFPQLSDTPEVAAGKMQIVKNKMRLKQQSYIDAYRAQGFDVKGFEDVVNIAKSKLNAGIGGEQEKAIAGQEVDTQGGGQALEGDVDGDGVLSKVEQWIMLNPDSEKVPLMLKKLKMEKEKLR